MANTRDLIGALLIGVGIFMTWAWTVPGYQGASALSAVVEEKEVELAKKKDILAKIQAMKAQYESRSEEISRLSQVIPTAKSIQEVIAMIESAASVNGLRILTVAATGGALNTNSTNPFERVTFEVELEGGYPSLYGFMGTVEKNLRLLDVVAFDINPPTGEASAALAIKVKMEGYVLKEVQQQAQIKNEE